jgi:hypothetical protein
VLLVAEERAAWREGSTLRTHGPLHNFDRFVALFILLGGNPITLNLTLTPTPNPNPNP